jgi:hypothetical protein
LSEFQQQPAPDDAVSTGGVPGGVGGDTIPADWMAAQFLALAPGSSSFAVDGAALMAVRNLANERARDVDLVRAAGERGVTPRTLAEILAGVQGALQHDAVRLTHGWLTRAAWNRLARALDNREPSAAAPPQSRVRDDEIDVLLWTDKPAYRPRDLATINAAVSKPCHLTLIDVDQDGKAIVLFPNELEQDNLVAPGAMLRVPGSDAGYQLRFDRAGEEQIVAICQSASRTPAGIDYDYEKQRFKILGDWRTFLRSAQEQAMAARNTTGNDPPGIAQNERPAEGRAAITVTIDPGGS